MNHLNTRRAPYAFCTSDMGELGADTEPAPHYTADEFNRASTPLDWPVIEYTKSDMMRLSPSQRDVRAETKKWFESYSGAHRAKMPRQQIRQDGRWANAIYAAITLVAMAGIGAMLAWRG